MSIEHSYVPRVQLYLLRFQFMSPEYSLSPTSTVYGPRVQFISQEYSLCPQSTVYRDYGIQGNKNQDCMHSWHLCLI